MKTKRSVFIFLVVCGISTVGFAQDLSQLGQPDPTTIGVATANQLLREISVTKFEDAGLWTTEISVDFGNTKVRRIPGGPLDKVPIQEEVDSGIVEEDEYVLGVRTNFYKRAVESIIIRPYRPIPIEGISKMITFWMIGRNYEHTLKLLLQDYYGNDVEVTVGKLNFSGWRKLSVVIPPSIKQRDLHYTNHFGLSFVGFRIDCNLEEASGSYYAYFDDMRSVSDLFSERYRDPDDISDNW